jgi:hypothetical protein
LRHLAVKELEEQAHQVVQLIHSPGPATILPPIKTRGTIVRKATPINPALQRFVDMNLRVRDVISQAGTNRVPTNRDGIEMCLAYHLKGVCNSNCARNNNHKEHQPTEVQAMVCWCELHSKPE